MIYLDNAATTGSKPPQVLRAVSYAMKNLAANPGRGGHPRSLAAADTVYRTREKISDFFGANGAENVAFTANCTHSLNFVIKGIAGRGDHVVISSLEHNAVIRPLIASGAEYTAAKVSLTDDDSTLENFRRAIRPNTRLVLCTGASNVLGKRLPVERIGALCKERGVPFAVDAAQTGGVVKIDMRSMQIDYLCLAPHKGLYAPMGTGILICRRPLPRTVIEGGTGTDSARPFQPAQMPERFESGTVNVPGIAGISAGIDFVTRISQEKIYEHEMRLCGQLYHRLEGIKGVRRVTPFPARGAFLPVVSFGVENRTSEAVAAYLAENGIAVRGGLHCAPSAHRQVGTIDTGLVRISPAYFNSEEEMEALCTAVKKYIQTQK